IFSIQDSFSRSSIAWTGHPIHPPVRSGIVRLPLSSNKDAEGRKMAEFTLRIDGMHCGSCVRRVSQALAAVQGVEVNEVRIGAARLTAAEDPAAVDLAI